MFFHVCMSLSLEVAFYTNEIYKFHEKFHYFKAVDNFVSECFIMSKIIGMLKVNSCNSPRYVLDSSRAVV